MIDVAGVDSGEDRVSTECVKCRRATATRVVYIGGAVLFVCARCRAAGEARKVGGGGVGRKWIDRDTGLYVGFRPRLNRRGTVPLFGRSRCDGTGAVECAECGVRLAALTSHINNAHQMSATEYRARHGTNAPLYDVATLQALREGVVVEGARRYATKSLLRCHQCGTAFRRLPGRRKRKFCSPGCTVIAASKRRRGATRTCPTCGAQFYRPPSVEQTYCSLRCRPIRPEVLAAFAAARERHHEEAEARHTKTCLACGRTFRAVRLDARTCGFDCRERIFHNLDRARAARRKRT